MKLPSGITGYGMAGDEHAVDAKYFTSICYAVAQQLRARLIECKTEHNAVSTYYYAVFQLGERRVMALCNRYCGFMAFSPDEYDHQPYGFVDEPGLASAFGGYAGLHILSREVLETYPSSEHLAEFSEAELRDIAYWKPGRLGDIIFNWWD
jgi:hypothetical protein